MIMQSSSAGSVDGGRKRVQVVKSQFSLFLGEVGALGDGKVSTWIVACS